MLLRPMSVCSDNCHLIMASGIVKPDVISQTSTVDLRIAGSNPASATKNTEKVE